MLDSPQLSWTHLRSLMALNNSVARQFYMEMCRLEHWSTRTLDEKIETMNGKMSQFLDRYATQQVVLYGSLLVLLLVVGLLLSLIHISEPTRPY